MDSPVRVSPDKWDVIIIGGSLSGSATAIELLKLKSDLKILILESKEEHGRRVGESTVEVSSYFLSRVLGLSGELNRNHISKQGLRFWFSNKNAETLADCSEIGPKFNVLFPGYQVDRSRLDEVVLQKAIKMGAVLKRPAKVVDYKRVPGGWQAVQLKESNASVEEQARWIVDASGVRAIVGRKEGWIRTNEAHPIATVWSRWKNVLDWDDISLAEEFPDWSKRVYGVRNNATNHTMGRGWWAWWIPLQNGDVSVGLVYDQRLLELPQGDRLGERLKQALCSNPVGERLLRDAEFIQGDVSFRRNISYSSERLAGNGFALVGDAAGFLDPFYSPGLDWVCYTVMASSKLIADSFEKGEVDTVMLDTHNRLFRDSYDRWFQSIYKDKYFYMGDFELMGLAFRLDLGFYYLGVVSRPFLFGPESLRVPSFGQKEAKWPAALIGFYNRRLAAIGRKRMRSGRWGRSNDRHFHSFFSYRLNWTLPVRLAVAVAAYGFLELKELFSPGDSNYSEDLKSDPLKSDPS